MLSKILFDSTLNWVTEILNKFEYKLYIEWRRIGGGFFPSKRCIGNKVVVLFMIRFWKGAE